MALAVKNPSASEGDSRGLIPGLIAGLGRSPRVSLPREFHGQRSLAGYSPWGHKESVMTKAT